MMRHSSSAGYHASFSFFAGTKTNGVAGDFSFLSASQPGFLTVGRTAGRKSLPEQRKPALEIVTA